MKSGTRLYRLVARCPKQGCQAPPRLRVPEDIRASELGDPDRILLTYQCHRCNTPYPIRAKDFYRAA